MKKEEEDCINEMKIVDKMLNSARAKRRKSSYLPSSGLSAVNEIDENDENIIWMKVSDKEMMNLHGSQCLLESLNEEQDETVTGRCKCNKNSK